MRSRRSHKRKKISYINYVKWIGLLATMYMVLSQTTLNIKTFMATTVLLFLGLQILSKYIRKQIFLHSPLSKIDRMQGEEFEEFLKYHFEKKGYQVSLTPKTGDYGADLILKKKGKRTVVQAKRYQQKVGNSAVQEIVAAKNYYKAEKCMVVTNSYFSQNAIELAKVNDVELWDRDMLKRVFSVVSG